MAASPAFDLQQAVYGALVADGTLTTLLGGPRVYDAVPDNAAAPYVHLGEATVRDRSTGTEDGVSVTFIVVVWSREAGRAEGLSIAERVRELIHDAALTLNDHVLVNLRHEASETATVLNPAGRRVTMRFRAVLEPV